LSQVQETFLTSELMTGSNWSALERAVARVMSHCGWDDVRVIGRSGDNGCDVLGKRIDKYGIVKIYVVQVKAVQGASYVGPSAIDESMRALHVYGADIAVVATNGEFTKTAIKRQMELNQHGYSCKLWNGTFLTELIRSSENNHWQRRHLRQYQLRVTEATLNKFHAGGKRAQFVVATGLGKSTIAAEIMVSLMNNGFSKCLVLCHSQDLSYQLEQSFWSQLGKNLSTHVFINGLPPNRKARINFGTYQTMVNYLSGFAADSFDLIIVDEAHHSMAGGFLRCINHFKPKLLVGMTATPWRGDGLNLNTVFGEPVDQVSLVEGMNMGYLAKASYRLFCDLIDWKDVFDRSEKSISISDLNKRLFVPQRDEVIIQETLKVASNIKDPRIIFFCPSIEHCDRIASLACSTGIINCKPLSGVERVERYKSLMEFSSGRINAVAAVDVLNEGIDIPDVNIIVFLRATHSRRIFIQQLGRGLRITNNKSEVVVLDFVTDIRRIAEVFKMDAEYLDKSSSEKGLCNIYLPSDDIKFQNKGELPFAFQWIADVADLDNESNISSMLFPSEVWYEKNSQ